MFQSKKVMMLKSAAELFGTAEDVDGLAYVRHRLEIIPEEKHNNEDPIDKEQIKHAIQYIIKEIDNKMKSIGVEVVEIGIIEPDHEIEGEL